MVHIFFGIQEKPVESKTVNDFSGPFASTVHKKIDRVYKKKEEYIPVRFEKKIQKEVTTIRIQRN